ncbi:unnamed protein product [Allacma fusca]|uniref:Uncharacterized protein n=1 Tax=Allacma fusca TaxID=39272 RepID=A0A8J2P0P7_9HEXA|nr:unnamed protein product [Allacma fusca]
MHQSTIIVIFAGLFPLLATSAKFPAQFPTKLERYWWRKGFWRQPSKTTNPLEAGMDLVKMPFKICRSVNYKGESIPGKFLDGANICYIGFNGSEIRLSNPNEYQLLDTDKTSHFEWIPSRNGDIANGAVIGGISKNFEVYFICTAAHLEKGKTVILIGKLQPSEGACFVAFHGKEFFYESYNVLRDSRYAVKFQD